MQKLRTASGRKVATVTVVASSAHPKNERNEPAQKRILYSLRSEHGGFTYRLTDFSTSSMYNLCKKENEYIQIRSLTGKRGGESEPTGAANVRQLVPIFCIYSQTPLDLH